VHLVTGAAQQEITAAAIVIPFIVSAETAAYMVRGVALLPRFRDVELLTVVRNQSSDVAFVGCRQGASVVWSSGIL
jgi:hypothetical protein